MIVAANRDEFYDRPSAPLEWWDDYPQILAGRDLKSGGAWMGVTRSGRFAAVTNYRDPKRQMADAPSRGLLVKDFLIGSMRATEYIKQLEKRTSAYNGFNLLVDDGKRLIWFSNKKGDPVELGSQVYGLSNHLLDTPWPKVIKGKRGLQDTLPSLSDDTLITSLLMLLTDSRVAFDDELPETGVGLEWERTLSPIFVKSPIYGTRTSSVILFDRNNKMIFVEKTFNKDRAADSAARSSFSFPVE